MLRHVRDHKFHGFAVTGRADRFPGARHPADLQEVTGP
jgi:hypothetical protein